MRRTEVGPDGWGPVLGGGQGLGLTHDVTGREWMPEGLPTFEGGSDPGGGKIGQLRGDIMELLADGLVLLGNGCEHLGYPTQLMRDGDQPPNVLGKKGDGGGFREEGAPQRFRIEVREIL